jgi:hypothetical protein
MATESRIYTVTESANAAAGSPVVRHLVRASSPAQAIRHITNRQFVAQVSEQDDLVDLAGAGVKVQDATAA